MKVEMDLPDDVIEFLEDARDFFEEDSLSSTAAECIRGFKERLQEVVDLAHEEGGEEFYPGMFREMTERMIAEARAKHAAEQLTPDAH